MAVLVKSRLWPRVNYRPHVGQTRVHNATARHRVNAAGRRFGKSNIGGHELTLTAFESRMRLPLLRDLGIRQEYWVVGPTYTDAEKEFRVFYNDCVKLGLPFDKPGTYNDVRAGNMQVSMWGGKLLVMGKSAMKPETLVGEGLHGVIMAEAAKMKASVWSKYIRPTLADFQGWSLWNSTPEGKNHFYEMWELGQSDEAPEWWSGRSPSWLNNYVFPLGATPSQLEILRSDQPGYGPSAALAAGLDPEIVGLYQELGPVMFGQEVECSFSEYAGLVYGDFDEETHVKHLAYDPSRPVYLAADYGYTNPNVMLFIQTDVWDNVYVLAEYYQRNRTETEFAHDVLTDARLAPLAAVAREFFPDPEDPSATRTISNALRVSARTNTGGLLKNRINLIRKWLKIQNTHLPYGHVDRQPRLFVDRSCTMLRDEFQKYRYPEVQRDVDKEAPENPLKKDDHALEALSRFFAGKYGKEAQGRTRVRQSSFAR